MISITQPVANCLLAVLEIEMFVGKPPLPLSSIALCSMILKIFPHLTLIFYSTKSILMGLFFLTPSCLSASLVLLIARVNVDGVKLDVFHACGDLSIPGALTNYPARSSAVFSSLCRRSCCRPRCAEWRTPCYKLLLLSCQCFR